MSTTAPNSWAVMNAGNELAALRARLIAICPDIEEDQTLFHDMLEGEAPDALAVIERLIDAALANETMAAAVKARQDDLAVRKARFEKQSEALRAVALQELERINLRKLQRPQWTASISGRPPPVLIDDKALPDAWWRIEREPRKADIRKALLAGERVEGAQLGNAMDGLTVRTK